MRSAISSVGLALGAAVVTAMPLAWAHGLADPSAAPQDAESPDPEGDPEGEEDKSPMNSGTFSSLSLRSLGPAVASGRISDVAIDPRDPSTWYVATASGGMWKTTNSATSWKPIFDGQDVYAIGCVTLDPTDPNTVWVGTGENNSQRSVGWGNGIYRSLDGGSSWKHMGLETSEHIGEILIDPRNPDRIFVAAQGPLWREGGDRGLYRSEDGGETWTLCFEVDEHTGVSDIAWDPANPDRMVASSYQRRRHVGILLDGGPGCSIWRSTDGGANWSKSAKGLPSGGDLGRIGLAWSPHESSVVYATVAAAMGKSGFFRSTNGGLSWSRMSDVISGSPQYYCEIYCDPHRPGRIYMADVRMRVSDDEGASFRMVGESDKHVDNHSLNFASHDPNYLLVGCDGGLYESWNQGKSYKFIANLPITQFYRVAVDQAEPFYNVYGGTQDNFTWGGPSRTTSAHGIRNSDWHMVVGGDGFQPRVDPTDPNIVYGEWQYAGLVRLDRRTGERVDIQPQAAPGSDPLRWHWNTPLWLSSHDSNRLYVMAQRIFRSDDRGDSWQVISGDLSRGEDRNAREVMGRLWSVDAVAKNKSSSPYGTLVAFGESPLDPNVLVTGSDEGLIQVTRDGGANWRRIEALDGVPERAMVSDVVCSTHAAGRLFAAFEDHKEGNFAPYLLRSDDLGGSWTSIAGDLPEDEPVWTVVEDHVDPDLLFVGTEFGLYFTRDGGEHWIELSGGLPTIAVRDLEIQRRENDLVLATFGRGFYVLDDYSALRGLNEETLAAPATMFPIEDALMFSESPSMGYGPRGYQGGAFYRADNPPFGAIVTYHMAESLKTRTQRRRKEEKELAKDGGSVPFPSWEDLEAEDRERAPLMMLVIRNAANRVVRRIEVSASKGMHRVAWDLTVADYSAVEGGGFPDDGGYPALPGRYSASLEQVVDGVTSAVAGPMSFEARPLIEGDLSDLQREELGLLHGRVGRLQAAVESATRALADAEEEVEGLRSAFLVAPENSAVGIESTERVRGLLQDLRETLDGDRTRSSRYAPSFPGLGARLRRASGGFWSWNHDATATHRRLILEVEGEFETWLGELRNIVTAELPVLHDLADRSGAPWSPGRGLPNWSRD